MKVIFLVSLFLFYIQNDLHASNLKKMDDIDYKRYSDFEKKWQLVDVRYRKDTEEIRYIYANPKAWQALQKKIPFPDGAVLGKVAYKTKEDDLFPSSLIKDESRRIQLMVKDSRKYSKHYGWGYGLYSPNGDILQTDDIEGQVASCSSCHEVASVRDYVFTQSKLINLDKKEVHKDDFKLVESSKISSELKKYFPRTKNVNLYVGSLTKNVFFGTLDEIRPILIKKTLNNNNPSALISGNGQLFSIVFAEEIPLKCREGEKTGSYMKSVWGYLGGEISTLHFCAI